jgi:hypothetical protein
MDTLIQYVTVYLISAFRFFLGPTLGIGYGLNIVVTAALTTLGMMTTVYAFSYFSHAIHRIFQRGFSRKKQKVFTPRKRKFVKIWKAYGIKGVAFITPIILSPIIGAILCNAVGGNKNEIIKWMWISAGFWALFETTLIYFAGGLIRDLI